MKRLGYLSAAPRVSTRADTEVGAPRAHILGVILGFEAAGWVVNKHIVGDQIAPKLKRNLEQNLPSRRWRTLLADFVRLASGPISARIAWRRLGTDVDWVYERLAAFQTLGGQFRRHGIPWILETNSPYFIESAQERKSLVLARLAKRMELAAYRNCDVVVCVSDALKNLVVEAAGIDPHKVVVMANAVDTRIFDPALHTPRRVFCNFTVGFVGYVIEWQGLDLLLRAVATLRDTGLIIHVVIVGDGPARRSLTELSRELMLTDQVCFVGQVAWSEVPGFIAGFDIAYSGQIPLKAGSMYNSPMKLYEYMAMGTPVLASSYPDARSLIGEKRTGYLFEPGSIEDLTRMLQQSLGERHVLSDMGNLARQEIINHHSWEVRVRNAIPKLETLIEGQPIGKAM